MSRAILKNKRLRLEYRYLEVEKEEIAEASLESETELRKFEWYQQLCEKALGKRPGAPKEDVPRQEDVPDDDGDEFEDDDDEFDEDMPEWMRWKQRRRRGTVGKKRKKKIRNLLAECSEGGDDIWIGMPDWFKEMFDNLNDEPDEATTNSKAPKDKRLKKLYRLIVEKSHPDKVGPIYLDQFRRAAVAFQEGDIGELLNVADELNIPIPEGLERERNKYLEKQIKEMRMFIAGKKNTIGWLWAEAESDEDREAIRKRFCETYNIPSEPTSDQPE